MYLLTEAAEYFIEQSAQIAMGNFETATESELSIITKFKNKILNWPDPKVFKFDISVVQRLKDPYSLYIGFPEIDWVDEEEQQEAVAIAVKEMFSETGWCIEADLLSIDVPAKGTFLLFGAAQAAKVATSLDREEHYLKVKQFFITSLDFALSEKFNPKTVVHIYCRLAFFHRDTRHWRDAIFYAEQAESLVEFVLDNNLVDLSPEDLINLVSRVGSCFGILDLAERAILLVERNMKKLEKLGEMQEGRHDFLALLLMDLEEWKKAHNERWNQNEDASQRADKLFRRFCA